MTASIPPPPDAGRAPSRARRGGALAAVGALSLTTMTAVGAAGAEPPVVRVDDFESGLPSGADGDGVALGFSTFQGSGSTVAIATAAPPETTDGVDGAALRMDVDVTSFAGFIHAFANEGLDTWVPQDWSAAKGITLWLYGQGSGTTLFVDVLENRNPGSTSDDAERWSVDVVDDFTGWKELEIPFSSLTRKGVGNGAPDDGWEGTEVHGWALGALGTGGPRTYWVDNVGTYGVAEIPPLTVGFAARNVDVPEGATGDITVRLNRPWQDEDTHQVTVDYAVEPGAAVPDRDFLPVAGTLTFIKGGPRELIFPLETFDNAKDDGDRRVILRLSDPVGAEAGVMQASGTILDDEPFDPLLLDDVERAPYLWDASSAVVLTNPEIAAGDPGALPGQGAWERVLEADIGGPLGVDIDVQGRVCTPGNGVVTVSLLSTPTFDATSVDHTTVTIADTRETHIDRRTGIPRRHEVDTNRDGLMDLVFHVRSGEIGVECDSLLPLHGETFDGQAITNQPADERFGRDFPLGEDWSNAEGLSFWYEGQGTGRPVTVELLDNRAPDPGPGGWDLVWSDEFDEPAGTLPNPANWGYEIGDGTVNGIPGWGNSELQYYTDSPENAATDGDGNMVITLREADGEQCYYGECDYTSARLLSKNRAEFAYGRIESRIQVPDGEAGLWPAFWSLGTDIDRVGWPETGEIDMMEYVSRIRDEVFGTIHGPGYSGGDAFGNIVNIPGGVPGTFRTYSIEWQPDRIEWYLDGDLYHTATPGDVAPNEWVFNDPVFLLLNMAIGGSFGGAVSPDLTLPQEMKVDYVRVYQGPDTAERFEASFVDDVTGWQQVTVPFGDFVRSADQPAGAPDDGLGLDEVWGYGFRLPSGSGTVRIDQVRLDPIPAPSQIEVTTLANSGDGSLRSALGAIAADGTITFDPALAGGTVALTGGPLVAGRSVTVDGSGALGLVIDGGGAVRVLEVAAGAAVTVSDLTLTNGYGFDVGGAVINNGSLTLERVVVSDSRVTTGGIDFWKGGGGIYTGENGVLVLRESTVTGNAVEGGAGGGVYGFFGSDVTIERSTISGNSSNDVGGGVRSLGDTVITNSTISGNTSTGWHGGGVFHTDGALTLSYSTVTDNTAPGGTAGGLFMGSFGAPSGRAALQASIVAGNSGDECVVFYGGPFTMESLGFNVLGDGTCGAPAGNDQVVADALLGPLADNGGPTWTHALLAGGPAIDAGEAASAPTTDQRGVARPQGAEPDVGAFELE